MIKKMMALVVAVAALVAFAVPAVAQAGLKWNGEELEGEGSLSWVSATGLVTGPAPVTFTALVESGGSTGSITTFVFGPIPNPAPNCKATGTATGLPWQVHLNTPDTMTITGHRVTFSYTGAGCAGVGIPPSVSVTGDVTLTITGAQKASANPYNDGGTIAPTSTVYNPITNEHVLVGGKPIGVDIQGTIAWAGASIE